VKKAQMANQQALQAEEEEIKQKFQDTGLLDESKPPLT
jgi:hypothetical protein